MLLAVSGGTAWRAVAPNDLGPADGDAPTQLPDKFFDPSPWLDGTSDRGPIGPLIGVIGDSRKTWTNTEPGLVGISATTGEYRFLDLPDASTTQGFGLSPDGRHLAYWITGETQDEPNGEKGSDAVVGYAVYDTVSDEVVARETFATKHGLDVENPVWADDDTFVFKAGQWLGGGTGTMDASSSNAFSFRVRHLDDSSAKIIGNDGGGTSLIGSDGFGAVLVDGDQSTFAVLDTDHPSRLATYRSSQRVYNSHSFAVHGRQVVALAERRLKDGATTDYRAPLLVGRMGTGRMVQMREVPAYRNRGQIAGWRDDSHVLVVGFPSVVELLPRLLSVDIHTGEVEALAELETQPAFASGLPDSPRAHATEPPTPLDPRLKLGLTVAGALAAMAGLLALRRWRRRARP